MPLFVFYNVFNVNFLTILICGGGYSSDEQTKVLLLRYVVISSVRGKVKTWKSQVQSGIYTFRWIIHLTAILLYTRPGFFSRTV